MKPFTYLRPDNADEAVALLTRHGSTACVIAGGQTLLLALKDRTQRPEVLVSLAAIDEFAGVRSDPSGELVVGAATSYATLTRAELPGWQAVVARMAGDLADRPVRTMGTIGGALCACEPRFDMPVLVTGVDARIDVVGPGGTRSLAPEDFFVPDGGTSLAADDIVACVRFPALERYTGVAFEKFRQRKFDAAIVSVLCAVRVGADGALAEARITVGAATAVPRLCTDAAALLVGLRPDEVTADETARAAAAEVLPNGIDDLTVYRRELIISLTRKALTGALTSAPTSGS